MKALLLLAVALAMPPAADTPPSLESLRETFLSAVEAPAAIEPGLRMVEEMRAAGPDADRAAVLTAYQGALIGLRAKHGSWPPARLRHMREGLRLLDAAARERPEQVEVRYLRLMSCYYLPGVFGRGWSVREDFAALARLLPGAAGQYPPALYAAMLRFVIEHGRLAEADRGRLRDALADA